MNRDVEVDLTFLPTEHGGRRGPVRSGHRAQFYYGGHDWDVQHEYPDVSQVHPGETVRAYLTLLSPAQHVGKFRPGMLFLIREGQRVVGYGCVRRILDLENSAAAGRKDRGGGEAG
jgi:translation elongation factor EF-Tu-like GTPase